MMLWDFRNSVLFISSLIPSRMEMELSEFLAQRWHCMAL